MVCINLFMSVAIRDFPRALLVVERHELLRTCTRGIQNCSNLRACTWTRDGSLSDDILEALSQLPQFCDLEINGHNEWQYSTSSLLQFTRLRKLCLIMPSTRICEVLPQWLRTTGPALQRLTLIDRVSILVSTIVPLAHAFCSATFSHQRRTLGGSCLVLFKSTTLPFTRLQQGHTQGPMGGCIES